MLQIIASSIRIGDKIFMEGSGLPELRQVKEIKQRGRDIIVISGLMSRRLRSTTLVNVVRVSEES